MQVLLWCVIRLLEERHTAYNNKMSDKYSDTGYINNPGFVMISQLCI